MKADHKKINRYIQIARGQLDGIMKMIEDDDSEVLSAHLACCVRNCPTEEMDQKVEEIKKLIERMSD